MPLTNFNITADWGANGVTDLASFESFLDNNGYTNKTVADFILNGNIITANVTSDVSELSFAGLNISGGLKFGNLVSLIKLYLNSNQIVGITPLSTLINLTELNLSFNQIVDTTPLSTLVNLTNLILRDNQITDLTDLTPLVNLIDLSVGSNQLTTQSYADIEAWANNLSVGAGTMVFSNNTDSISGTNLETILIAKGRTVVA